MIHFRSHPTTDALLPFQNFDRFFEEAFGALEPLSAWTREDLAATVAPRVNVWENEGAFELKVELPGVTKEQVQLELKQRQLTITAEVKKAPEEENGEATTLRRFERGVYLPPNIETDRIDAKLADGLLTVTLPKATAAKPRAVEIN